MTQLHTLTHNKLPHIVYFRDDHLTSQNYIALISNALPLTWSFPGSWAELVFTLETSPDLIAVHVSMIEKYYHGSATEFVKALQSIAKCTPDYANVKISVVITPDTTQRLIKKLQKSGVAGILLDPQFWSIEESKPAIAALLANESYWPADIISELPLGTAPILPRVISIRVPHQTEWTDNIVQLIKSDKHHTVEFCSEWDAFTKLVSEPTDLILFHCKMLDANGLTSAEIVDMISSISRYTTGKVIKIGVVVDKDTSQEKVKELRKLGLCGLVPSAAFWGVEVGVSAVTNILDRGLHWPKDIINHLPGGSTKLKSKVAGIYLTSRQFEVMELVCKRGLSNKSVAKMLKISESTVKIHVSAVMRAYGVRNRTQLALTASSSLKA